MRDLLAAMCALSFGQAALADKVQPFVDYAMLLDRYADKVTTDQPPVGKGLGRLIVKDLAARGVTKQDIRFPDLGNGIQVYCKGLTGSDCDASDRDHDLMDIGCALTGLAGMLQLAERHEGFASDQDKAALAGMFERVVVHLADNALPPRGVAEIKADAARSATGFATAEADAMNLGDESDVGAIILRQALKDATSAKYLAKVNERLSIKRLPVTNCGDDIGLVP